MRADADAGSRSPRRSTRLRSPQAGSQLQCSSYRRYSNNPSALQCSALSLPRTVTTIWSIPTVCRPSSCHACDAPPAATQQTRATLDPTLPALIPRHREQRQCHAHQHRLADPLRTQRAEPHTRVTRQHYPRTTGANTLFFGASSAAQPPPPPAPSASARRGRRNRHRRERTPC
ncbi:hypothetical protein DFH09DRAFT_1203571 [Mycena vulgaris]|nr:hypothetical protein DFH09DRAFT_1203571 [Mycena vulgaris]